MSRKVDRQPANKLSTLAFMPGVSYNGQSPLIDEGDEIRDLLLIACNCGEVVGHILKVDRRERTNPMAIFLLITQEIESATEIPKVMRVVENVLKENSKFSTQCPAHGHLEIDADQLLDRASKVREDGSKPKTFFLSRRVIDVD